MPEHYPRYLNGKTNEPKSSERGKTPQTERSNWYMLGSKIQSAEASAEYVKTAAHLKKATPQFAHFILFGSN